MKLYILLVFDRTNFALQELFSTFLIQLYVFKFSKKCKHFSYSIKNNYSILNKRIVILVLEATARKEPASKPLFSHSFRLV